MKPVFIAASPNTQKDDVMTSLKQLFKPTKWFSDKPVKQFEKIVSEYFDGNRAIATDSARSAFYLLLKAYGIGAGDEVVVPAFTCLVVVNPILWVGAKPVYVDVDDSFNLNLEHLKQKVSKKTKLVLVQHSFGKAIDIPKLRQIVGPDVRLVEDLAHALGGRLYSKKLGTIGDAAILTFGIEKVISTVRGGMVLTKDKSVEEFVRAEVSNSPRFSRKRVLSSLLNPIFWSLITPVYYLGIGKLTVGRLVAWFGHRLGLFGNMIEGCEYKTDKPDWLPAKMPGALAELGIKQFGKLDYLNAHRNKIAEIYKSSLGFNYDFDGYNIYLRFPILVNDQQKVLNKGKKNKIILGDWYKTVLYAPKGTWLWFMYEEGDAPKAELFSKHIINLPTGVNVSEEHAKMISTLVKDELWIS